MMVLAEFWGALRDLDSRSSVISTCSVSQMPDTLSPGPVVIGHGTYPFHPIYRRVNDTVKLGGRCVRIVDTNKETWRFGGQKPALTVLGVEVSSNETSVIK